MQAIGNKNELWLFFEIDQMAYRPNAACDTPKSIPIGHIQDVVILTTDGLKTRLRVPGNNGITFHPNNSHIFGFSDKLYLYSGESASYKDSIFKWENDHFKLLSIEEGDTFISNNIAKDKKMSLEELKEITTDTDAKKVYESHMEYHRYKDGKIIIPYGIAKDILDILSKRDEWEHYIENMFCCDDNIKWNGLDISINTSHNENDFKIVIKSSIFDNDTSSISLDYDKNIQTLGRFDYEKMLKKRKKQKPHKKH